MIPRIRARVGQGDDQKWYFEISLWNFIGTEQMGEPFGPFGPYDSEAKAKEEMRKATELCVKACRGPSGEEPEGYVDLKNGGEFREIGKEQ
jgi:hypothetical protein